MSKKISTNGHQAAEIPVRTRSALLAAAVLGALLIPINIFTTAKQDALNELERDEWYFATNEAGRNTEIKYRHLIHAAMNDAIILGRIGKPFLSKKEQTELKKQAAVYAAESNASINKVAESEYSETHELSPDANLDAIFSMQPENTVSELAGQYQQEAFISMKKKKAQMVRLDTSIKWGKLTGNILIIIQLIVLIYGQVGMFKAGSAPGA